MNADEEAKRLYQEEIKEHFAKQKTDSVRKGKKSLGKRRATVDDELREFVKRGTMDIGPIDPEFFSLK